MPTAPISARPSNRPSYEEMIYRAIEALKEKNGSSKRAIGKYIDQVYKDQLPSTHSTLLTHHLKRLKNSGFLVMVKKSYKLSRSAHVLATTTFAAPSQASRPKGRPRKVQSQPKVEVPDENMQLKVEPMWLTFGLSDERKQAQGRRRYPTRPKKSIVPREEHFGPTNVAPAQKKRSPRSQSEKTLNLPPKTRSVKGVADKPKRHPGRPPKNHSQATQIPLDPIEPMHSTKLPTQPINGDVVARVALRPRGRPKKNTVVTMAAIIAGAQGQSCRYDHNGGGGQRQGKGGNGLPMQPRKSTGKPVGRPKKGSTSASASQNAANGGLRGKLEHFQSKVKQSVAVLKPHFNKGSPVTVIAAIKELEMLGTMDLNAPLKDEALPQPPKQQQIPLKNQAHARKN
ncbi:uncharacterized protein LOC113866754 [Abrus precatorius]|uniref:Uncharacterized protein LOC113866754 n=1 Tax=Abrus precatorius TaxID=3816 RepID=A0A8B8LLU1_ABRPR|nr:uncharacterized protein LOC113866754 [Abrus precatorius]